MVLFVRDDSLVFLSPEIHRIRYRQRYLYTPYIRVYIYFPLIITLNVMRIFSALILHLQFIISFEKSNSKNKNCIRFIWSRFCFSFSLTYVSYLMIKYANRWVFKMLYNLNMQLDKKTKNKREKRKTTELV